MNKKVSILLFVISLIPLHLLSQESNYRKIAYDFEQELIKDSNIIDIESHKEFFTDGSLKSIGYWVQFADDSVQRFFHVGECLHFYKGGQIRRQHYIDPKSLLPADSSIYFKKNGDAKRINITTVDKMPSGNIKDSSFNINETANVTYQYINKEKGFVFEKGNNQINGKPVYEKNPLNINVVNYNKGKMAFSYEACYNLSNKTYEIKNEEFYGVDIKEGGFVANKNQTIKTTYFKKVKSEINWEELKKIETGSADLIEPMLKNIIEIEDLYKDNFLVKRIGFPKGSIKKDGTNVNSFFIAKDLLILNCDSNDCKVLTAKDIDGYSQYGKVYESYRNGETSFFVEKIYFGSVILYKKEQYFEGDTYCYYIYDYRDETIYVITPYRTDFIMDSEYADLGNMKDLDVKLLNTKEKIREYLCGLPNIDEKLNEYP